MPEIRRKFDSEFREGGETDGLGVADEAELKRLRTENAELRASQR